MEKEDDGFMENIERLQKSYYDKSSKNLLFKSKQKLELAAQISSSVSLPELIQRTCYIINNTNKVFVDYTIFKLFANPSNYNDLVNYMISLISWCIKEYDCFEVHVNLDSFTISACHRHKDVIETYLNECMKYDTEFTNKLIKMHLYNVSQIFDSIKKALGPFIHEIVKKKIEFHNKEVSPKYISDLLQSGGAN